MARNHFVDQTRYCQANRGIQQDGSEQNYYNDSGMHRQYAR